MIDIEKLRAAAGAAMTPEHHAVVSDWKAGRDAEISGAPDDERRSSNWRQAWAIENVKRRVRNGEAIAVLMGGTRCKGCGSVNYGYRLGCRCNGQVEWGALVLSVKEGECAPFYLWEELRQKKAAGMLVVNCDTGADFCLDEREGEA